MKEKKYERTDEIKWRLAGASGVRVCAKHSHPLQESKTMKAADVTQHSLDVPKASLAAENPILGTWKLQSLVYEVRATGQRSSPFSLRNS